MDSGQINSGSVNVSGTGVEHEKASIMQAYFRIAKAQDYLGQSKDNDYLRRVFSLPSFNSATSHSDLSSRTTGMYAPLSSNSTGTPMYFASNSSSGYDSRRSTGAGYRKKDLFGYSI
ncbi:MAG: hypothetical protein V2A62_03130 [Candidatus Woesearchaeota archaeon]